MKKHTYLAICIITSLFLVGVLLNVLNPARPALAAATSQIIGQSSRQSPLDLTAVSNDLVGYWSLDEGSGSTAVDLSANGNDGTLTNGPTYTSNVPGAITFSDPYALTFDGVDDYVSLPDAAMYDFALDEDFTVAVWVQVDATQADIGNSDNSIVEKWSGSGGYPFMIRYMNQTDANAGRITVARYDGSANPTVLSTATIDDGQYHHVVFIKDGATLYLYIDGVPDGQTSDTTTGTTTNNSPLYLGQRGNGNNRFKGELDDLRIYNRALSATEVALLAGGADGLACATEYTGDNVTDFISSDSSAVTKTIAGAGTYTFGPTLAKVVVNDDGGCLTGLSIQRENSNHPQATDPNLQTGVNWTLSPAGCSSGFTVTLTLPTPNFTPDANSKLCRWDTTGSSWDCGQSSNHSFGTAIMSNGSTINAVTRSNVNEFSQWTAGNSVGPTAVRLQAFTVSNTGTQFLTYLAYLILILLLPLAILSLKRRRCK